MNVLIIEDEPSNEKILRQLLERVMPEADSIVSKESVRSSIEYLSECTPCPDLIFADIQLSDGLCFDIFDTLEIQSPVIFTTAYDCFALKAFEYNALSYLLKPVMEKLYESVKTGNEAQISIDTNSQPDYREKLNAELKALRESEMWRTGETVRKLRPENN